MSSDTCHKQRQKRSKEHATIPADFNFSTTTTVDNSFQFIDCTNVDYDKLAKDIRSGVIELQNYKIIIAIGNQAAMDNFTNVVYPVNGLVNAIIDRYGCVNVKIWVLNILPRPLVDRQTTETIQKQNKGLAKVVAALIRRKNYLIVHVSTHKWFLKCVKESDGDALSVQVDRMYYCAGTIHLNQHGLEHFHLLLVKELQLWDVQYEWSEIPIVLARGIKKRRVLQPIESNQ